MAKKTTAPDSSPRKKGGSPYHLLRLCLRLGELVREGGGDRVGVPKSVVAKGLDMDHNSSTFALLVASAKTYGIVAGLGELRLTEFGRDYFLPMTDTSRRTAELAFLKQPPVFSYIIEKFDGSTLPKTSILGNLLGRECGVSESWKLRVAQMFVSAATDLGIVDQAGRLRYGAAVHLAQTGAGQPAAEEANGSISTPADDIRAESVGTIARPATPTPTRGTASNVWQFSEAGGIVRLETPDPLPKELWARLKRYVEVLNPEP